MPRQSTVKDALDDALLALRVQSFEGGLDSETDPSDLDFKFSPDCENVKLTQFGRIVGRLGSTTKIDGLAAKPDGIAFFYDASGSRHKVIWTNGNMYDVTADTLPGAPTKSGAYTAGNRICWAVLNNILYYSDGETIFTSGSDQSGIRQYNGTSDSLLITSGTAGTIPTPACKVMTTYAGQLVIGRIKYVGGTYSKHGFMWANVNDPTTIIGTNIQFVGQGYGGEINAILPLAVASVGVSPFQALLVGKSQFGIFAYSGNLAPGGLKEFLVNCPTGIRDGATLAYIPGPDGSGYVVFLGTDNKVWAVNGTAAVELSSSIRTELGAAVQDALAKDSAAIFTSVVNSPDFQYVLDVGNGIQYIYHYDTKAWTRYRGWGSGYWCAAYTDTSSFSLYLADRTKNRMKLVNVGVTDDGVAINPYWNTPFLSAGDANILKIWKWIYAVTRTDIADVIVTATTNLGQGAMATKTFKAAAGSASADVAATVGAVWDQFNWDEANWALTAFGSTGLYKHKARFTVNGANGPESLRGFDVTIKFSTNSAGGHFEILGFTLMYLPRGRKRVVKTT